MRKETCSCHIGYSYRLTARVLLYAPSHRHDNTYHGLWYTSRGALAGTRNSSMGWLYGVIHMVKDHSESERGNSTYIALGCVKRCKIALINFFEPHYSLLIRRNLTVSCNNSTLWFENLWIIQIIISLSIWNAGHISQSRCTINHFN